MSHKQNMGNLEKNAQDDALSSIYALAKEDFDSLNQLIPQQLSSSVDLVEKIGHHIVDSGGKRLRPLIVLLTAGCFNYMGSAHIQLAAMIEFLHRATLLHDDVVDKSNLRRGKATSNSIWGNSPSVLVGDFLYSRAFQLMVVIENMEIMRILSNATNRIAEGEVLQLSSIGNFELTEGEYMQVINSKTAMLFEAAAHTSAVLSTQDSNHIERLKRFGIEFGVAYQLIDDWLDYAGDVKSMGKNIGDDLAEGKLTLPLIYALKNMDNEGHTIKAAITDPSNENIEKVIEIVRRTGALAYTAQAAMRHSKNAIEALNELPNNKFRNALEELTRVCMLRVS